MKEKNNKVFQWQMFYILSRKTMNENVPIYILKEFLNCGVQSFVTIIDG